MNDIPQFEGIAEKRRRTDLREPLQDLVTHSQERGQPGLEEPTVDVDLADAQKGGSVCESELPKPM